MNSKATFQERPEGLTGACISGNHSRCDVPSHCDCICHDSAPCADEVKKPEKITMGISQMDLEIYKPGPITVTLWGTDGRMISYDNVTDMKYDGNVLGFTCETPDGRPIRIESNLRFITKEDLKKS